MSASFVELPSGSVCYIFCDEDEPARVLLSAADFACCSVTSLGKFENMSKRVYSLGNYVRTPLCKCLGLGEAYVGLICLEKI